MTRDEDKGEEVVIQTAASEALGRALNDTEPSRLLQYTCKAPAAPEGYQNRLRVVYSQVFNFTLFLSYNNFLNYAYYSYLLTDTFNIPFKMLLVVCHRL